MSDIFEAQMKDDSEKYDPFISSSKDNSVDESLMPIQSFTNTDVGSPEENQDSSQITSNFSFFKAYRYEEECDVAQSELDKFVSYPSE